MVKGQNYDKLCDIEKCDMKIIIMRYKVKIRF